MTSNRGYKYFGAAKDLPGVRELFEKNLENEVSVTGLLEGQEIRFIGRSVGECSESDFTGSVAVQELILERVLQAKNFAFFQLKKKRNSSENR